MASASSLLPRHCSSRLRTPLHLARIASRPRFLCCAAGIDSPHTSRGSSNLKHEKNPTKAWDNFYKRHHNKFFKDRHYLKKDWESYFSLPIEGSQDCIDRKVVLEVGCGPGNTLFPLVLAFPNVFIHACDFSHHAIALVKEHETFRCDQVNAFVCDVTKEDLCETIMPASVDIVTMIFMLSAVSPVKMPLVLQNVKDVLKPSGLLLFRDYALGDFAQEKLANKNQKISENFYARGDGTHAFYFSEDLLSTLFEENGFNPLEIGVYCKEIVNRSRKVTMNRRWIRGAFRMMDTPDSGQPML